nr:uncharacterized protein LOC111997252 [Quercus suber]POE69931.1 hypothetical protein CFP56_57736 [Quercus suber]
MTSVVTWQELRRTLVYKTIGVQAKTNQQQRQNILSASWPSSIATEEEVAEALRLFTESIPERYWEKSLNPQLDAVASLDLGEDYQGMDPTLYFDVKELAPTMSSTARPFPTQGEVGTELLLT